MQTCYSILDFRAVIKHAYYGTSTEMGGVFCDETGRKFPDWRAAAQGFISRYIEPILLNNTPRNLLVAHDMGHEFRSAFFPEYKAKRKEVVKSPVEVEHCEKLSNWAKALLAALGATQLGVKGVEADDVIAWLCERIAFPKEVYTVDADLLQLCNDATIVYLKG